MQPARFPLALFTALLIAALVPVVDLAGGSRFGPRGFAGGALSDFDRELDFQSARSAVASFAGPELAELEAEGGERTVSLSQLAGAVRDGAARRIREIDTAGPAAEPGFHASEVRRVRQSAASLIRQIDEAGARGVATVFLDEERAAFKQTVNALFRFDAEGFVTGILTAVFFAPAAAIRAEPVVVPLALVVLLALVSVTGGGLCRMAAVHAGRARRLSVLEGSGFARSRALRLSSLPVLPIGVLAILAGVVAIFALLLRLPVLNVLSAILFVVPLAVALLGAIVAIVAIVAAPLMPAAIAVEDCDPGEAITRACSLVLSRPLQWLAVLATGVVALTVGSLLVTGVLVLGSNAIAGLLGFAGGDAGAVLASRDPALIGTLAGPDRLVAMLAGTWGSIFAALGGAYGFSIACDLSTRAYLLMRAWIDGESPSTIAGQAE